MQNLYNINTLGLNSLPKKKYSINYLYKLKEFQIIISNYEKWFLLGKGSNIILGKKIEFITSHILIKDKTWLGKTLYYDPSGISNIIEVSSGETWNNFVNYSLKNKFNGLENLSNIPGLVGSSPIQNIGSYGMDVSERLYSVISWDTYFHELVSYFPYECDFDYRNSCFKKQDNRWMITSIQIRLPVNWNFNISYFEIKKKLFFKNKIITARLIAKIIVEIREKKLPNTNYISHIGSFFKNPDINFKIKEKIIKNFPEIKFKIIKNNFFRLSSGFLIESCGWKGKNFDEISVYKNQALILINNGFANSMNLINIAQNICNSIQKRFGILIYIEPNVKV